MIVQLPFSQPHPLEADPELRALRKRGPIHKVRTVVGDEAWMVTGYHEVRALMDDERLGRSHRTPQTAPRSRASVLFGYGVTVSVPRLRVLSSIPFSPNSSSASRTWN